MVAKTGLTVVLTNQCIEIQDVFRRGENSRIKPREYVVFHDLQYLPIDAVKSRMCLGGERTLELSLGSTLSFMTYSTFQ